MSTLTDAEKKGLKHFFRIQDDPSLMFQVAKSLTRNLTPIESENQAIDAIFLHCGGVYNLLNKRVITKEVLFKYLHHNKISVTDLHTKISLIEKIIQFWNSQNSNNDNVVVEDQIVYSTNNIINEGDSSTYPIHLLARKFAEWFFDNYNKKTLKIEDFWADSRLDLRIIAKDGYADRESVSNENVLQTLVEVKEQFRFYFNPNVTHQGVQGRMNVHGLVLVLSCGTLHHEDRCVGVFESTFGLMRDPFSDNNWKMKTLQFLLRSADLISSHRLEESESIKEYLNLPIPPDIVE